MSNEYMIFAEVIRRLTPEEEKFLKEKFLTAKDTYEKWDERTTEEAIAAENDSDFVEPVMLCEAFEFNTDTQQKGKDNWGRYLHFNSWESGGDFDELEIVFTEFLKKFRPEEMIVITWAETCSKAAAGAFGGGGIVVTVHGAEHIMVRDHLIKRGGELLAKGVE